MMLPLVILHFVLSANLIAADISAGDGISYDDLKQLNVSCHPEDTCVDREPDTYPGIISPYSCSCHAECSMLDTCCIDSPHRGKFSANHKCGVVDFPRTYFRPSGYFMVHSCPENSAWKHLCDGDLDKDGDVLKIAPVSSLETNTTYKNYYCFRCHEVTDNFLYWPLNVLDVSRGRLPQTKDFKVTYNETDNTWSATAADEDISETVRLKFITPLKVTFPVIECIPKVISDCPDSWEDDIIRSKCESYTALLYKSFGPVYKNAHCALCNSQPLHELSCKATRYPFVQHSVSFAHLIDVNGDLVDRKVKCADGEKWDPYAKKCRKLSCALPKYVIKDGKCVAS